MPRVQHVRRRDDTTEPAGAPGATDAALGPPAALCVPAADHHGRRAGVAAENPYIWRNTRTSGMARVNNASGRVEAPPAVRRTSESAPSGDRKSGVAASARWRQRQLNGHFCSIYAPFARCRRRQRANRVSRRRKCWAAAVELAKTAAPSQHRDPNFQKQIIRHGGRRKSRRSHLDVFHEFRGPRPRAHAPCFAIGDFSVLGQAALLFCGAWRTFSLYSLFPPECSAFCRHTTRSFPA